MNLLVNFSDMALGCVSIYITSFYKVLCPGSSALQQPNSLSSKPEMLENWTSEIRPVPHTSLFLNSPQLHTTLLRLEVTSGSSRRLEIRTSQWNCTLVTSDSFICRNLPLKGDCLKFRPIKIKRKSVSGWEFEPKGKYLHSRLTFFFFFLWSCSYGLECYGKSWW